MPPAEPLESGEPLFLRFPLPSTSPSPSPSSPPPPPPHSPSISLIFPSPGPVCYAGVSERVCTLLHHPRLVQLPHLDLLQAQGQICQGRGPGETLTTTMITMKRLGDNDFFRTRTCRSPLLTAEGGVALWVLQSTKGANLNPHRPP